MNSRKGISSKSKNFFNILEQIECDRINALLKEKKRKIFVQHTCDFVVALEPMEVVVVAVAYQFVLPLVEDCMHYMAVGR